MSLAVLLALAGGCGQSAAGVVLVFPNDADRMAAVHATFVVVLPSSPTDDECPQLTAVPPLEPDASQIELTADVDLSNGTGKPLKSFPTGRQTVLVKVLNAAGNLFLHGCHTGSISSGSSFEITLSELTSTTVDMLMPNEGSVDDLMPPAADMAVHKYLSITTNELRASGRLLQGVSVSIVDANGSFPAAQTTDATGTVTFNVDTLAAPYQITASAPATNGYQGAVTLIGVSPTFFSNTAVVTVPIELDPPVTTSGQNITLNVSDSTSSNFDVYYQGTFAIFSDPFTKQTPVQGNGNFGPLVMAQSYRIGIVPTSTPTKVATPNPVLSPGSTFNTTLAGMTAYTSTLTVSTTASTKYTTQKYGVTLVLPAAPAQLGMPLLAPTVFSAGGPQSTTALVPPTASSAQPAAVVQTEMIGDGTNVHAELRHQLNEPIASTQTDTFTTALPDPPMATVSPSPVPSPMPFTVAATPPSTFPLGSAFVHLTIHDAANKYHWHVVAAAASPTMITLPGGIIPAGTYSIDVAFIQEFTLPDVTVQATLGDNYSKLLRPFPQELSQSTISLTAN